MRKLNGGSPPTNNSILLNIIEVLDAYGVDQESYTLHENFDVDALEQLVASENVDLEIRMTIQGITLSITKQDVRALNYPSDDS